MKSEAYKRKIYAAGELISLIFYAAAHIKKHEERLRRKIRDIRTRVSNFFGVDGGIFEHLLRTVQICRLDNELKLK
jgi:hypothetical protein